MNDEAKVRRSTKSLVLGKARVVSYEDLVEARAERMKKETAKKDTKQEKRGRKRKIDTMEADSSQPTAKTIRMTETPKLVSVQGDMSETHSPEAVLVSELQRVPVARMW